MASILVRSLDDDAVARLKQIAAEHGRSLERLAREKLAEASNDTREALIARIAECRARIRPSKDEATKFIRAMRDGRVRG